MPLLEAMAARVPVVAYASSAVPETLGGAGILLRTQDPTTVAATVEALRSDPGLRAPPGRSPERPGRAGRLVRPGPRPAAPRGPGRRGRAAARGADPGPFETSYSLATMNRKLALGLDRSPDVAVSLYADRGTGRLRAPTDADLAAHPEVVPLYRRSAQVPYPDVVIRQMWPPRTIDSPGGLTLEYFAWEESRVPAWIVDDFNAHLDGIGVTSTFVADALRDSGVHVPDPGGRQRRRRPRTRTRRSRRPSSRAWPGSRSSTSARPSPARGSTCCCGPTSPPSRGRTT